MGAKRNPAGVAAPGGAQADLNAQSHIRFEYSLTPALLHHRMQARRLRRLGLDPALADLVAALAFRGGAR